MPDVVILGCGYTGKRVAQCFLNRGASVTVTTRQPAPLSDLANEGARVLTLDAGQSGPIEMPRGALVLYSMPVMPAGFLARFTERPQRVVYLSTTGVYGLIRDVDESTPPSPDTEQAMQRLAAEGAVQAGPWSSLILRPAAIYGPGRGVHVAMKEGRFQLAGAGDNFVSRIHVEDLAAHAEAALLSDLTGAYPVADELPCTSREIAEFCASLLNLPMPLSAPRDRLHETRRSDRRVDGRAVRSLLNLTLEYPSYREGVPASL
jgi:nucleoside-diphosphate-sugar epimerase